MQLDAGQVLDGMGFFAGSNIRVDGTVNGTTFATGQTIVVTGDINGDLFVAGQTINISGTVSGNIYTAGQGIVIGGQTAGDAFLAGQDIRIENGATIGRDVTVAGAVIGLEGMVGRDMNGGAAEVYINGTIGRNVNLEVDKLDVAGTAVIGGDLAYKSPKEGRFAPGSTIKGRTDYTYVDRTEQRPEPSPFRKYFWKLLGIGSALLIWLAMRLWKPAFWSGTSDRIYTQPLRTLGTGALVLIVTPIALILLMVTVIGIPLAVLSGIMYGVAIFLSKIVVAAFLAYWATKALGWHEIHLGVWLFLLGYVVITLLRLIPYFGAVLQLFIIFFGLGALFSLAFKKKPPVPEVPEEEPISPTD